MWWKLPVSHKTYVRTTRDLFYNLSKHYTTKQSVLKTDLNGWQEKLQVAQDYVMLNLS